VLLPTDRLPVKAGSGDRENERLPTSCTAVAESVPQAAVTLGVQLVKQQSVDVQPLGTKRIGREHPVERIARLMHDRLAAVDHLKVTRQRRRSPHHRRRFPVDDASLLAVAGRTVDFGTRLGVKGRHVESDAGERRALALLLWQLDVPNAVFPRAVWVQPAKQLTHDAVLPRQERERLAGVLPLAVAQDLLEEVHYTLVLGLALFAEIKHRGA
jgi:hypothetical protein